MALTFTLHPRSKSLVSDFYILVKNTIKYFQISLTNFTLNLNLIIVGSSQFPYVQCLASQWSVGCTVLTPAFSSWRCSYHLVYGQGW